MFKKIVGLGFNSKGKNAKDARKYVRELIDGGATEFFTGYNPPYWSDTFGFEVSPNGRFSEHEQITDLETLKIIVEEAHTSDIEVFINLNAWYYSDETFPIIERMLEDFDEAHVDGIICGNIGILEHLKSINYKGKINISTIMAVYNSEAIKFLIENYKLNKVILSREISLAEIEKILLEFPEMKFEVFGEGDFCRYNNGLCFAEHKYGSRDICTVVVNDLIIKKRYNPAFKEIALNKNLTNLEKLELLNDEYLDDFDLINKYFDELELVTDDKEEENIIENIKKLVEKNKNNPFLYYDALKSPIESRNKKIISMLKAVKLLNNKFGDYTDLKEELEQNIKTGMKAFSEILRDLAGNTNVLAKDKDMLYNRNSNLNLHAYLFFSKFKNIETVKFPTRGRQYTEKLNLITKTVEEQKIPENAINIYDNIERTHYDLTYLFGDKLWYRELLKQI